MAELTRERHRPFGPKAECFRELLRRYPQLADHQLEKMISIYQQLTILEVALFSADEGVADRFDAFVRCHSDRLRAPWQNQLVFALVYISSFALIVGLIVAVMR